MPNAVIDASVIIEYVVTGPYTANVQAFFEQLADTDRLLIPEFCLLECTNVLWKQVRFNGMGRADAQNLTRVLTMLKLRRVPMKTLLARALDIALDQTLAIYDSAYIALAEYYSYPLLTLDSRQRQSAVAEGVAVFSITDFRSE